MPILSKDALKYRSVLQAVKYLNSTMQEDDILKILLEKSVEILQNADTGLIFLYNSDKKYLEVKCSYGFNDTAYEIIIQPGESITGQAFTKNETLVVNGVNEVRNYMHEITFYKDLDRSPDEFLGTPLQSIQGVIACPIQVKDVCIGVIVVDNFSNEGAFTSKDVDLLEAISHQAALAISNAQLMESIVKDKNQIQSYSQIIEAEKNRYKYTLSLHTLFMDLMLKGASEKEIVCESAKLLKCQIVYVDQYMNICAASSRHNLVNFNKELEHIIEKNLKKHRTVCITYDNHFIRFEPILIGKMNHGWIVIIRSNDHYTTEDGIVIDLTLTILSLVILNQMQIETLDHKYRGEFIDLLIAGDDEKSIEKYAFQYNLEAGKSYRLLLIHCYSSSLEESDIQFNKHIERRIRYNCQLIPQFLDKSVANFIASKSNWIYVIFEDPGQSKKDLEYLMQLITDQNDKGPHYDTDLIITRALMSNLFNDMKHFHKVHDTLKRTSRQLFRANPSVPYSFYEDNMINQLLLNNSEDQLLVYMADILGPLVDNTSRNNTLLETLKIYIQSNDNWTYTKDKLFIHGNTLTQRLKKISDSLEMDLNNYRDHMQIQLALEIHDVFFEKL